ncbi:MAG: membrane-bound lytic murein transglycosylase MltF [Gammaproteobacteria bacterium]
MRIAGIILFSVVLSTCSKPPTSLEEVLNSGQLRVLTRNSPTTFYEGGVGYDGLEYQLASGFAAFLEDKYERSIDAVFSTRDQFHELLPAVSRGQAHIAAAGLTVSPERAEQVDFGPVYQTVSQQLIYRLDKTKPTNIDDLGKNHLEVIAGSSFVDTLQDIRQLIPNLSWTENAAAETSELLVGVDKREIDLTIADSNEFAVHRTFMPDLRVARELKTNDQLAWAFSPHRSDQLQEDAALYFAAIRDNGTLDQLLDRFYGHTDRFDYVGTHIFMRDYRSRLEPYREMFYAASEATGIDWRLLAAIAYQESHWNPNAVSYTGVRGMMQLTRITANSLGVANREDPAEAIPAGAKYFAQLRNRLKDIPEPDRTWFALAAYNVGYGHLRDARRLTVIQGGNPDRWLDVKESLPLLAVRKYYSTLPHGYARGWEPVQHVSNIRTYFEILNWLAPDEGPAAEQLPASEGEPLQTASIKALLNSWL